VLTKGVMEYKNKRRKWTGDMQDLKYSHQCSKGVKSFGIDAVWAGISVPVCMASYPSRLNFSVGHTFMAGISQLPVRFLLPHHCSELCINNVHYGVHRRA
jgi:hypothetical protein